MLNRILLPLFLFIVYSGFSMDRKEATQELLTRGEYDLVIKWLEPYIERGNYEHFDYSHLIVAYMLKEDYFNGLAHTKKWMNASLTKNDTSAIIFATDYKCNLLYGVGDLDGSIAATEFGLKYVRPTDSIETAILNLRLGIYQWEKDNFDLAYNIYSEIDFESIALAQMEATYFSNFGVIYHDIGLIDSGIYCMRESMNYNSAYNNDRDKALKYNNLAVTFIGYKNYDLALAYLDTASSMNIDHDNDVYQKIYQNYFSIYDDLEIADSALVYVYKIKELNQSLFSQKMELETKELEDQYIREFNLKTKIIQSDEELEKSKLQFLLSIILILLIILTSGVIILLLRYKNLKTSRNNLLTTQQLLRSQITPHFLYNSLSTIQGMILKEENKNASDYLSKFSRLVRLILKNSRDKTVVLSDELEAIRYYLDLQNARFDDMLKYHIHKSDEVQDENLLIPPMLIQPFVENCIEHGFKNIDRKGTIDISFYFENKSLICEIKDNGVGFNTVTPDSIIPKKESISTGITKERLALMAKEFKSKASLTIVDRKQYNEQGTIVHLEIPYKYD